MRTYLQNLITEKGTALDTEINIDGHMGLTYEMLIDFLCQDQMKEFHGNIRKTLVKIDFCNGDVFDYLRHLTEGMVKSLGY